VNNKRDILTIKIEEAIKKASECPLCLVLKEDEKRYIEAFFSEHVMNPEYRKIVIHSRGFCKQHFQKILDFAIKHYEELGLALVLKDIIESIINDLKKINLNNESLTKNSGFHILNINIKKKKALDKLYQIESIIKEREQTCPACKYLKEFDEINADTLAIMLSSNPSFLKEFKESKGLCLLHLIKLLRIIKLRHKNSFSSLLKDLLSLEMKSFTRLNYELKEFIRKHDYRFSDKPWGIEKDSVKRSIIKLIGEE